MFIARKLDCPKAFTIGLPERSWNASKLERTNPAYIEPGTGRRSEDERNIN